MDPASKLMAGSYTARKFIFEEAPCRDKQRGGPRITIITETASAAAATTTTSSVPSRWHTRIYLSRGIEQLNVKMITEHPAPRL